MPHHYRVTDYTTGTRLESLQLARSSASTKPGFLRLFYALNPRALRGSFGVRLHDDGADVLFSNGRTATSFMRVSPSQLPRWRGH